MSGIDTKINYRKNTKIFDNYFNTIKLFIILYYLLYYYLVIDINGKNIIDS